MINFCPRNFPCDILYLTSKILRFYHLIQFLNCLFVWDQQHGLLPTIFQIKYYTNKSNYNFQLILKENHMYSFSIKYTINYKHISLKFNVIKLFQTHAD